VEEVEKGQKARVSFGKKATSWQRRHKRSERGKLAFPSAIFSKQRLSCE
jgi:hypothetical protein